MKYVLDTDHMTFLERGGSEGRRVRARLLTIPPHDYATTIVTYEEQMRGWLSRVAQAHTTERLIGAYMHLSIHLDVFTGIRVLRFDDRAATEFERFRRLRPRIGTQDTKIAAIAMANDATLLSRNLNDFGKDSWTARRGLVR